MLEKTIKTSALGLATLLLSAPVFAATPGTAPATPHFDHSTASTDPEGQGEDGQNWATITGVSDDYSSVTSALTDVPYAECGIGGHQSPIAINLSGTTQTTNPGSGNMGDTNPSAVTQTSSNELRFNYVSNNSFTIFNSGHAIQVNTPTTYTGELLIGKDAYPLTQFHFHAPSEHYFINAQGKTVKYAGELHFVHQRADGKIVVVGVLLDNSGKESNQVSTTLQTILNGLPASPSAGPTANGKSAASYTLNPKNLLPADAGNVYTYAGSLSTPPCSEGVEWFVLEKPIQITDDLATIQADIANKIGDPLNARVIQNSLGRTVQILHANHHDNDHDEQDRDLR